LTFKRKLYESHGCSTAKSCLFILISLNVLANKEMIELDTRPKVQLPVLLGHTPGLLVHPAEEHCQVIPYTGPI